MKKIVWICISCTLLMLISTLYASDYLLPYPPPEFFEELYRTEIPPGQSCCNKLRKMLEKSVMIPANVAVKLFKEGKITIGDARTTDEYNGSHIFGAFPFPYDQIDFMNLEPTSKPIALY